MANQSIMLKAAGLQTYFQTLMEIPPGALLKANNTIINRDGVIESRRGIKAYNSSLNPLAAKAKQLFEYKGRILAHLENNTMVYDDGNGLFTPFSGSYIEPISGYRMRSAEGKSNFYFTSNTGVKRISAKTVDDLSLTDVIQNAGVPKGLAGSVKVNYSVSGFLTNGNKVSYRMIWTLTDRQLTSSQGAPSALMTAENKSIVTDVSGVDVTFLIPQDININNYTSYKYSIYRSEISTSTPSNELRLIYEKNLSLTEVSAVSRSITITDTLSESLRSTAISAYTNSIGGTGLISGNEQPPSARDIALFKGHMFYGNTRTKHSTTFNLLQTSGFASGSSNLIVSNGSTTNTYTFQGTKQITDINISNPGVSLANITTGDYFLISSAENQRTYTVWFDKTTLEAQAQVATVIVGATLPAASSYFILYSGLNQRKYVVWFDRTGSNVAPVIAGTYAYIKISALGAPTSAAVATTIYNQLLSSAGSDFTLSVSSATVTITNKVAGPTTDIFRSTSPLSNLTGATSIQGTGGLPGTIPLRIPLSGLTTAAQVAQAIATAFSTLTFDFITIYTPTASVLQIFTENNGYSTAASSNIQGTVWCAVTTIQTGLGEDTSTGKILISGKTNANEALEDMANSIIRVINYNPNSIVDAYYFSAAGETPGKIYLQSKNLEDTNFFVGTQDPLITSKFNPELGLVTANISALSDTLPSTPALCTIGTSISLGLTPKNTILIFGATTTPSINGKKIVNTVPTTTSYTIQQDITSGISAGYTMTSKLMSAAEVIGNRIYYSKYQIHESVPLLYYIDVGSRDQNILRIIALRESLFIFKGDGVFRLAGDPSRNAGTSPTWDVGVFDNTSIIKAPDTAVTLGNQCYYYSNQGIAKLNESSLETISRPIEDKLIPYIKSNPNLDTACFAVAYESDRALLMWGVSSKNDTVATVCYRYNTATQTWTEWKIPKKCAVLNAHEDVMYFGSSKDEFIEVERKNFDRFDYADREFPATLATGNLSGSEMYLALFASLSVGDVLMQEQYVSISQFNSLLKQLDLDPQMPYYGFYDLLKLQIGEDLTEKMVGLRDQLRLADPPSNWTAPDSNGNTNYEFTVTYSFPDIQTQFNQIIDRLNQSKTAKFDNYPRSIGTKKYECYIVSLDTVTKKITLNIAPAFMLGLLKVYKGIPIEVEYAPQHAGDPASFKQFSSGTLMFERMSFYSGKVEYNSDISDHYEEISLFPLSSSTFGGATWGDGCVWGGNGDQADLRTYIPLKKQRCRFIGCRFVHTVALENFQLYGLALSYRTYAIQDRDYR